MGLNDRHLRSNGKIGDCEQSIIVLELSALSIRNNDQIKGIAVDGSEIKLVSFDIKDVLFGILDTDNLSILVNYILLESKYFINLPLYVK